MVANFQTLYYYNVLCYSATFKHIFSNKSYIYNLILAYAMTVNGETLMLIVYLFSLQFFLTNLNALDLCLGGAEFKPWQGY
jgi:hypothetical protein